MRPVECLNRRHASAGHRQRCLRGRPPANSAMSRRSIWQFLLLLALWPIGLVLNALSCECAATPVPASTIMCALPPTPSISPIPPTPAPPTPTTAPRTPIPALNQGTPSPAGLRITTASSPRIGPEWVTAISAVVYTFFTIILALVAVFQDDIRRWRASARLKVSIQMRRPWCARMPDEYTLSPEGPEHYALVYYLRLAVE